MSDGPTWDWGAAERCVGLRHAWVCHTCPATLWGAGGEGVQVAESIFAKQGRKQGLQALRSEKVRGAQMHSHPGKTRIVRCVKSGREGRGQGMSSYQRGLSRRPQLRS